MAGLAALTGSVGRIRSGCHVLHPHMGSGTVARALRGDPESWSRDGLSRPLPRSFYRPDARRTTRYHAAFGAGFESRLGIRPVGFRTPSGDWSPHTATILKEFGVLYSSSMRGDDRPYFHPGPDGKPGLVEIPGRWDIDDYTALAYFEEPDFPTGHDRIADFRAVEANWRAEFEGFHRHGLCWTTILHPKVSAKLGRLSIIKGLFEAIRAHDDVWIARGRDIAQWWIDQNAPYGEGEAR